ncbi:class I SAM-dependent methyltransferase [Mycobacterium branderi]|uniref:Demethylmenaquinone methyltransferase n=1 Tax=Mycobacterium branderi TaxID=43348 RepID=A0A7I7VYM3_9MYCO|nr:class I SAM-dependent methyltransferase [Mycobacterium branderi]MCV7233295.1 methyltransferase domain-containing protein [Mycobacterium branderi]ORA41360.1 SAM-dependent methyltransferase [Mycobacterium branderi]BBZ10409.1 demethylmenaquinone methyltransferase [Mycobacterium branderi]
MTKHRLHRLLDNHRDYLPAAGRDIFLPGYDLISRLLGMTKVHDTLIGQAELDDNQRVLEIGCGTGNVVLQAKRGHPGIELVGCDPDPRALTRARRKAQELSGIRFDQGYAQQLPYPDGEFDRVLSSMMLHHLPDDVKADAAAEVFRVLRPGGRFHVVDIGGDMTARYGLGARRMLRSSHIAGNLGDAIPRLLSAAGFDCREVASHRHRFVGRLTYYRATRPSR